MRVRTITCLVACAAFLLPACSEAQTEKQDPPKQANAAKGDHKYTLTYFTMPGWMLCEMVEPAVRELETQFKGKMNFAIEDYSKGDNPALIKKYGFKKHGMVITDKDGKKVWGEGSHNQKKDAVAKVIEGLIG